MAKKQTIKNKQKKQTSNDDDKGRRTRYYMLILYPDNVYHCEILDFLKSEKNPYQGCYIFHTAEKDEKKDHWHVMMYYPNPRTKKGVCDSFGKGQFRKVGVELNNKGDEVPVYEPCPDSTGVPDEEIEIMPLVGDFLCSPVSDCHSMAMYFLHKTFSSIRDRKKEYSVSDIKAFHNDFEFTNSLFEIEKVASAGTELQEIIQIIKDFRIKTFTDLIITLYMNNPQLVKYVEKHSYLIKQLL